MGYEEVVLRPSLGRDRLGGRWDWGRKTVGRTGVLQGAGQKDERRRLVRLVCDGVGEEKNWGTGRTWNDEGTSRACPSRCTVKTSIKVVSRLTLFVSLSVLRSSLYSFPSVRINLLPL